MEIPLKLVISFSFNLIYNTLIFRKDSGINPRLLIHMISNIDIARRKTGVDKTYARIKFVTESTEYLYNHEHKIVTSKRFSRFMERLVQSYSEGEIYVPVPVFHKKHFPELVVSKFNSYAFEHKLIYDYIHKIFVFT